MKASVTGKNQKYTALAWVLALLVLAVAIPVNLIAGRMNVSIDMTPNSIYTLTDTTEKYLNTLDSKGITVDVYFLNEMGKLAGDSSVLDLYRTLKNYDAHPCFNLIDFDPETDPELGKKINPEGVYKLEKNDFFFVYGENVKRVQHRLVYTQELSQNADGQSIVTKEEFRAERLLTSALVAVVENIQTKVYFLEGHGEHPMSDYSKLTQNLRNFNYGCETFNLINAEKVPDDCGALVIAGPTADISDEETDKLRTYAKNGGHIMLLMSPNSAKISYTNIQSIMSDFCLAMDYDRVYEKDSSRHKQNDPFIFMCELQPAAPESTENLTGELLAGGETGILTYMPVSRSFHEVYGTNRTTCSVDSLIKSYVTAVAEPYGGTYEDFAETTGQELILSAYSVNSMYQDAKLMVFGSAEFLTDEATDTSFFINPTYLFSAGIAWMQDSDADVNVANKDRVYDTLVVSNDQQGYILLAIFIGFPVLIAVIGIVVWLRRKDA